jgi:hypothetical protein
MARRRSSSAWGPGMDRAQRVDQHDLPVDPREMGAEEGFDHLALVGLERRANSRRASRAARGPAAGARR